MVLGLLWLHLASNLPSSFDEPIFRKGVASQVSPLPLFCQLSKIKYGYKPRSKSLSYTRLRKLILEAFNKDIVPDISVIGTLSLRSGGAAAAYASILDRLFKRYGLWPSDLAKDGYVKDSLFSRLSISQALGL